MRDDPSTRDEAHPWIDPAPAAAGSIRLLDRVCGPAGVALAAAVRGVAAVRSSPRPLHPRGVLRHGRVERLGRHGPSQGWGVPWLDEPGEEAALVRLSRSIGVPRPLPDVAGLALRVWPGGADVPGDLLFSSTGRGRVSRYLLRPTRQDDAPMTTVMPFRTARGPLVLGARRVAADELVMVAAAGLVGDWRPVARVVLGEPVADEAVDFDPVVNEVPGLEAYPWAARLRRPAYAVARRSRGGDTDRPRDGAPAADPDLAVPCPARDRQDSAPSTGGIGSTLQTQDQMADEMSEESFPGSDPPSTWAGPDLGAR